MTLQIIVGAQWGDEGKGRIVDWFASNADIVARYNGGDNAGHSVTVGAQLFKLHLIPSGIIHKKPVAMLGNGMVINPKSLLDEMESLRNVGIEVTPDRLRISYAAHLITPAHTALDKAMEAARGKDNIGTTGRGIGPAYTEKAARTGLRMSDLIADDFLDRMSAHIDRSNRALSLYSAPNLDSSAVCEQYANYKMQIADYVADTSYEICSAIDAGKVIVAEAAQGTLLDIDHGTYPFVTSSSTSATGTLTGLGLGLKAAFGSRVTGVVKAFQTRVGSGPFPTEVFDDLALRLRGSGENPWDEYGTTTGRPRRVGWLDGVLLRYATRINGLTDLVVTKLDILSGIETLKLCVGYESNGKRYDDLLFGPSNLSTFQPIFIELPGWKEDVSQVRAWKDLPINAQKYLDAIAEIANVPVKLVSVGPEREQVVER
jgi:adenylosuccinate synthase